MSPRERRPNGSVPFTLNVRLDAETYEYLAERAEHDGSMSEALRQAVVFAKLAQQSALRGEPVPTSEEEADRHEDDQS